MYSCTQIVCILDLKSTGFIFTVTVNKPRGGVLDVYMYQTPPLWAAYDTKLIC